MKFGMRKPSLKKSFKARTTGKIKRQAKSAINPIYGKKGVGFVKNPSKSIKNSIYHKTTFSIFDLFKSNKKSPNNSESTYQKNTKQTVTLSDVEKMNSTQKTQLYHTIQTQYSTFYNEYYNEMQKIEKNYSLFINNDLEEKYFNIVLNCYNNILEKIETYKNLQMMNNKLTGTNQLSHKNNAYICMAKAYEKIGDYTKAIEVCYQAIKDGFPDDGTKNGFEGRLKKLQKMSAK